MAKQTARAAKTSALIATDASAGRAGRELLREQRANEVFVALVGPAGAGPGKTAEALDAYLGQRGFEPTIIKASTLIARVAQKHGLQIPVAGQHQLLERADILQDRGDELRAGKRYGIEPDPSAIARLMLREIKKKRAQQQGESHAGEVKAKGTQKAFIIDSLRHPAEASMLREVYQDAFALLGVVCDPATRKSRIRKKFSGPDSEIDDAKLEHYLNRDERSANPLGQQVSDAFHQADYFVDNSEHGKNSHLAENTRDKLARFVDLITHNKIVRPTISETAMHHAHSAKMRSACLSRQVGAALVDSGGNIVATGTNDVPKAGGGLYGEKFSLEEDLDDHRCAYQGDAPFCSNNRTQNAIINELLEKLPEISTAHFRKIADGAEKDKIVRRLRETTIGELLEFSRAVHAEMNAILSASIAGVSPRGCRMYVTTFPCHYCARHIVAAGVDEVQFIEPYPKSRAMQLHSDSLTFASTNRNLPSKQGKKVLFRPFVGVAPRLYSRVFLKDRSYKDGVTGNQITGQPDWGRTTDIYRRSYTAMEDLLSQGLPDE